MHTGKHQLDAGLIHDKILGCLTGVGIGDAMGMPTEFLSAKQIRDHFAEVRTFQPAPSWHPLAHLCAGTMTDDTEQTLAIAAMLIEKTAFDASDVARALLRWADGMDLDSLDRMGPSTNYALKRLRAGEDPYQTGFRGNTNGAAMRITPIGCIHAGRPKDVFDDVIRTCAPTHLTDVAVAGASATACAVAEAFRPEADLESVLHAMVWGAREGEERARKAIEIAANGQLPWEVISAQINPSLAERIEWSMQVVEKSHGTPAGRRDTLARSVGTGVFMIETVPFVAGVMQIALGDPFEAIVLAANAGGDTDSLASIAGAICGALRGASAFPVGIAEEFERVNCVSLASVARKLTDRVLEREGR